MKAYDCFPNPPTTIYYSPTLLSPKEYTTDLEINK